MPAISTKTLRARKERDAHVEQYNDLMRDVLDENGEPDIERYAVSSRLPQDVPMDVWLEQQEKKYDELEARFRQSENVDARHESIQAKLAQGNERRPAVPQQGTLEQIRFSDLVFNTKAWKDVLAKESSDATEKMNVGLKALFESIDGTTHTGQNTIAVQSTPTGELFMLPRTPVTILDIIQQIPTDQDAVRYDEETIDLSNVNPIAQGAVYLESQYQIVQRTTPIVMKGAFIQVTEVLLNDVPMMRQRLDGVLGRQGLRRVQDDIVGGTTFVNAAEYVGTPNVGTDPGGTDEVTKIKGFLDLADSGGSQEINHIDGNAGESTGNYKNPINIIKEAAEEVYRNGDAVADAILMNSQDWLLMSNLQSTTGQYVISGGNGPFQIPGTGNAWPVVLCNSLPKGTVIVGAFMTHCALRDRQDAQVRIQEAQAIEIPAGGNASTVIAKPSGRYNVYMDARYGFHVSRPRAFTKITNFAVAAS